MTEKVFDLEDRFVEFSCRIIELVEALPSTRAGNYVGEAQSAESRMDFIHKMKIILKELKETRVCLKIITRALMIKPVERLKDIKAELEQLISIIAKSIDTAKKNLEAGKK